MVRLSCYDSKDNPIETLYQWDVDRIIRIEGIEIELGLSYELHFANTKIDYAIAKPVTAFSNFDILKDSDDYVLKDVNGNILTVTSDEPREDVSLIAEIPLMLLEKPDVILIYVVQVDDSNGERVTLGEARLPVIPRKLPNNYVSTGVNTDKKVADSLYVDENGRVFLSQNGTPFGEGIYI